MNWIESLYQTYKNCEDKIGDPNDRTPLIPICHTTQQAHIKIVVNGEGQFLRTSVIPKDSSTTITPCTEQSGSRSGKKPVSHPLFDKLQYIAGDFLDFGGEVTIGYAQNPREPYEKYIKALSDWCLSPYRHPKVSAILKYLKKGRVIQDLVNHKILHIDHDGKLFHQWSEGDGETPPIFKLLAGNLNAKGKRQPWQAEAFVKFSVESPNDPQADLESDSSIWKSWAAYYGNTKTTKALCFVSGKEDFLADQHPSKIRNSGDKTKLISSNDTTGFTYRGRFLSDNEACGVSFEVSQKAHNALRWLIDRQGWKNGDLAFVAWAVSGVEIPDPIADTWDLCEVASEKVMGDSDAPKIDTAQDIGIKLKKLLAGYSINLGSTDKVVLIGLNSATGSTGRLAITYYRQLTGSEFLERIQVWHTQCSWFQRFNKEKKFIGAPAPKDIARAAYSNDVDAKLCNATVERIIPCIIDGLPIPRDVVESVKRRACKRQSLEPWEWNKTLGIACSVYKYSHKDKEEFTMALDHERKNRDYLYGRLLAVADCLEGFALSDAEKGRPTNAARLMQRFADHPFSTWRTIELALSPYKARLGKQGIKYDRALQEIMDVFETEDYTKDTPLSGEFLLGFHTQRTELYKKQNDSSNDNEGE